jgi:ubiquinol-cytochrome c reductase cytochrome b subunit
VLGWLGSRPAEGWYVIASQICTVYYFAHFLIVLPVLGFVERPLPLPNSILESVMGVQKGGAGMPAGANAEPQSKG